MDVRRGARFWVGVLLAWGIIAAPAHAGYDEATALQGNAGHTGFASGGTLDRPPLHQRWTRALGASLSYPVIANGKAFVVSSGSTSTPQITAIDLVTGETVWWRPSSDAVALTYDGGTLYSLSSGGVLTAMDGASGSTRWVRSIRDPFSATMPIAVGGIVYVYLSWSGGALYAIDGDDGSTLWTSSKYYGGSPAADGRQVYVSDGYDCSTSAMDRVSGVSSWARTWSCYRGSGGITQTDGARVYPSHGIVSETTTGHEVEQTSGDLAALAGSTGVFRANGGIFARNLVTGVGKWTFPGDGRIGSPPLVVNGIAYAGSHDGRLFAVDLETGEPVWETQVTETDGVAVGGPGMAAGGGVLLVPVGGTLVAYDSPALAPRPGLGLRITAGPEGPTARDSAAFDFAADGLGYTFECRLDAADWKACASGVTYDSLESGSHIFEVRTADASGETISLASRGWAVKGRPKSKATISGGPSGTTNSGYATFSVSTTPDAAVECRLDGADWRTCTGSVSYSSLSDGAHTFEARAVDFLGNVEDPPAARTWIVDTRPPETRITDGPTVSGDTMSVAFAGEDGATYECRVGSLVRAGCTSPASFHDLDDGRYDLQIRARDIAGNWDPSPATATFTIGEAGPNTRLDAAPPSVTRSRAASVSFSSPSAGARFECHLDGGAWAACSSPDRRDGLADGRHVFQVRAIDADGVRDPSPAEASWTVDATPPDTVIDGAAPAGDGAWTFSFRATEQEATFRCQLDYAAWANCSSPATYAGLSAGTHELRVAASDAIGNPDESPATRQFAVAAADGDGSQAALARPTAAPATSAAKLPAAARSRAAAVPSTLSSALGTVLASTSTRALARHGTITVQQSAPGAGRMTVRLTARTRGRTIALARGTKRWTRGGTKGLVVRLTRAGRALLRRSARLKVTVTASFAPAGGGAPVRSSIRLTLRRAVR